MTVVLSPFLRSYKPSTVAVVSRLSTWYTFQGCVYTMKGLNGPKLLQAVDDAMERVKESPANDEFIGQTPR